MSPYSPPGQTRERIYRFVRDRLTRGLPPTIREVQEAFGFRAVQTARAHLEHLVEEGRLTKRPGKARGYALPEERDPKVHDHLVAWIPLLGRVPAGGPNTAVEEIEGHVPMHGSTSSELFALRVEGFSMTGVGIFPGDILIVRSQPTAESGEIVVALIDDEATVKTLRKVRGRVELHPENPDFEPIKPTEVQILGRVIEVRRSLIR